MRILFQCLLFLGCNAVALSAEILAWKTPISRIDTGGKASPKLVRLEKPPEASPFFGKDDELWKVTSIMPEEEGAEKLEWAVWNATSGRLVVKGSWAALFELQHHYNLNDVPLQCRVKLDAYRVPPDGSPPDASKQPAFSLSCITRSGQEAKVSNAEGESSISLETEATFGEDPTIVDTRIFAHVSLPDCPNLQIESSSSFPNHEPVWFARNFNGRQGIDLMVTTTLLLTDGTPFHDLVMRQEGEKAEPFLATAMHPESGNIAIGEKHWLNWSKFPIDLLAQLVNPKPEGGDADPFVAKGLDVDKRIKLNEFMVPDMLNPHFYGRVFDIRDALKQNGIAIHDSDLAGYDPRTQRAFLYSSDAAKIDMFQQLCSFGCCLQVTNLAISLRSVGEMRLMTRSGLTSSLSSLDPQSKKTRHFEVEPTLGENDTYVDLRCAFSEKVGEKIIQSLDTSATLKTGKFLKFFEKGKADGTKEAIEVKVEVLRHDH